MSLLKWLRSLGPIPKCAIIISGSIIIGASTYAALVYYQFKKSRFSDEGFVEAIRLPEELPDKRILVLGLENCGKSSFLSQLSNTKSSDIKILSNLPSGESDDSMPNPTSFNVVSVKYPRIPECTLNFWEIGHKKNMRSYWTNYFQDTDLVIFCVDSADVENLGKAYDEFHTIQADERLKGVPILILATKQDAVGAINVEEIKSALDVDGISSSQHKIEALSITIYPKNKEKDCIVKAESLIQNLCLLN